MACAGLGGKVVDGQGEQVAVDRVEPFGRRLEVGGVVPQEVIEDGDDVGVERAVGTRDGGAGASRDELSN